jgi:hypothetical protein
VLLSTGLYSCEITPFFVCVCVSWSVLSFFLLKYFYLFFFCFLEFHAAGEKNLFLKH